MIQRVVLGQPSHAIADSGDATPRELLVAAPLVILTIAVGLNWDLLLRYVDPAARSLARIVGV
jgi:NADH:ubiquinone oxidoreductase subunit 4 (subunit M)